MSDRSFVAVDIGNARIKLGLFDGICAGGLPEPTRTLPLMGNAPQLGKIAAWLSDEASTLHWWIASVSRPATARLIDWLEEFRPQDTITLLAAGDLPLEVRLERPDMVGIDRLVDALAVNRLRKTGRPAVIVDVGSAITVDLLSADGAFLGGAILPGIAMSARALHEFTDLLPLVDAMELNAPPPALGTATVPAIEAGLFWGAIGAIRELIGRLHVAATGGRADATHKAATADRAETLPQVFITGGAGLAVAELLGPDSHYVPNLTLSGIALTATAPLIPNP